MGGNCPVCNEEKQRLAQHWRMSSCGFPDLRQAQRNIIDGLVLAGATVGGNGINPHIKIGTTNQALAEWIAHQLSWLCQTIYEDDPGDEAQTVYAVRTTAHPGLQRYEKRWSPLPKSKGRSPPNNYRLGSESARIWYAYAGGLEWAGPYDSQRRMLFSALYDDRADWIQRVLDSAGHESFRRTKCVLLSPTTTAAWLDWIGDPIPGVEYKWADDQAMYRALREAPTTRPEYKAEYCRAALQLVRKRTDAKLTPDIFNKRFEGASAKDVADTLGGGDWEDGLRVAGVDPAPSSSDGDSNKGVPPGRPSEYDREDCISALVAAADELGHSPTVSEYIELSIDPHPDTIISKFGTWNDAKDAAALTTYESLRTLDTTE